MKQLGAAAAAWLDNFAAANGLSAAVVAVVLVHQLLQHATEEWLAGSCTWVAARSWFATACWFNNFATASWFDNFAAANWFAAAVALAAEDLLEQTAELGAWAAARINNFTSTGGLNNFAATNRFNGFAASGSIAPTMTQTIKQAEAGLCRAAGEDEQSQQCRGNHATHR